MAAVAVVNKKGGGQRKVRRRCGERKMDSIDETTHTHIHTQSERKREIEVVCFVFVCCIDR
jgi:hypothetical protein